MKLPAFLRHKEPKIEIEREADRLVVRSTPQRGGEFVGLGVTIIFFGANWYWGRSVLFALFGVVAFVSALYNALKGPQTTTLTVNKFDVASITPGFFDTRTSVARLSVEEIRYYVGGEDQPSGLYANTGWSWSLLIPGISETESTRIADLIYDNFPDTPTGKAKSSDIITLGLNP